jgi:hypothetical protein
MRSWWVMRVAVGNERGPRGGRGRAGTGGRRSLTFSRPRPSAGDSAPAVRPRAGTAPGRRGGRDGQQLDGGTRLRRERLDLRADPVGDADGEPFPSRTTSVTKNGLPPVTRATSSTSTEVPAASSEIATGQRPQWSRRTVPVRARRAPRAGVVGVEVVLPVGEHQQRREPGDPAPDVAGDVEGRLVGPVDVLEDQRGRPQRVVELREHRVEHGVRVGPCDRFPQRRSCSPRDVVERPERAPRQQVVAPADEHLRVGPGRRRPRPR